MAARTRPSRRDALSPAVTASMLTGLTDRITAAIQHRGGQVAVVEIDT